MALALSHCASRPYLLLLLAFVSYKALILLIAAGSLAFRDYDTSTDCFVELSSGPPPSALAKKFLRWDAVYFVHTAKEGYVYEQEWAFGIGFSSAIRGATTLARAMGFDMGELVTGVILAHAAHLVAVLALYHLTFTLLPPTAKRRQIAALIPSLLHIVSPAGIFLSAPYAESSFAALSFIGIFLFARGGQHGPGSLSRCVLVVGSGVVFGISAMFRSNGILSGLLFLSEAIHGLLAWKGEDKLFTWRRMADMAAICLGGLSLAAGFAWPQVLAWMRYCNGGEIKVRPGWCEDIPPSIYTHVQSKYWNVGFLRYWTPNQIPLFALAGPMLVLLIGSGLSAARDPTGCLLLDDHLSGHEKVKATQPLMSVKERALHTQRLVQTLAVAQTLLAIMALTSYHVQIINRISSGYAVWYWWTASCFQTLSPSSPPSAAKGKKRRRLGQLVVIGSVVYAVLQAGLFASFMPPA